MSKPLTDDQLANVRQCTIYLAYEEYDDRERADLDAALARLDFLERKLIVADKVVDAVRTIAPLVAAAYDEVKP